MQALFEEAVEFSYWTAIVYFDELYYGLQRHGEKQGFPTRFDFEMRLMYSRILALLGSFRELLAWQRALTGVGSQACREEQANFASTFRHLGKS